MQTGTQKGLASVRLVIDTIASRFTVQAFAAGLLSSFGHNPRIGIRDFDGDMQFVPDTFEKALVRVTVRTNAMDVLDEMKNDDRLVAHVSGELSFHGVTHSLSFDARVTRMGTMLRISGEFPLRQSDYGIKPVSFAGGALRLKDEVKFNFELVTRTQEESVANG